jgi:NADH-quinone oxidoreductase subunit M
MRRLPEIASRRPSVEESSIASVFARWISVITFGRSVWMWALFDHSTASYQFSESYSWMPSLNLALSLGVDGLSRFFVRLNTLLTPLCILASMAGIQKNEKTYYGLFLRLEACVNTVFLATDMLTFYIFFEAVLIPMFLIIGRWGSRIRKIRAAFFFFRYTLVGSVLMLLALLYMYRVLGTRDMAVMSLTMDAIPQDVQRLLWLACFASFAVKVPMLPVHIWLPEAHVEAPTAGSVILAGILLKLGSYGMMRVLRGFFPGASVYFLPLVYTRCVMAIIYTSRTAIRQTDMKRIIGYASVAHMNMTLVGLFSMTPQGVEGALLQMLSHGLVSGALFMCVGVLYDRHHSRLVSYYGGVAQTMPRFVMIFRFFTMANIALPGTSSFVGEFMILVGIFQTNTRVAFLSATGMILGGAYSLWLFNRVAFGNLKTQYLGVSVDVNRRERRMFTPLVVRTLRMGLAPAVFLDCIHVSCANLVEHARAFS